MNISLVIAQAHHGVTSGSWVPTRDPHTFIASAGWPPDSPDLDCDPILLADMSFEADLVGILHLAELCRREGELGNFLRPVNFLGRRTFTSSERALSRFMAVFGQRAFRNALYAYNPEEYVPGIPAGARVHVGKWVSSMGTLLFEDASPPIASTERTVIALAGLKAGFDVDGWRKPCTSLSMTLPPGSYAAPWRSLSLWQPTGI